MVNEFRCPNILGKYGNFRTNMVMRSGVPIFWVYTVFLGQVW